MDRNQEKPWPVYTLLPSHVQEALRRMNAEMEQARIHQSFVGLYYQTLNCLSQEIDR
jgi:hypothetical protein